MLSGSRSDHINRLADPLRGRFSNYDELMSEDDKSDKDKKSSPSSTNSSPKKKSPLSSTNSSPKKKSLRSPLGTGILPRKESENAGFFLTESAQSYDYHDFEQEESSEDSDDKTVTSYQMRLERELVKISPNRTSKSGQKKNRELSKKYDQEISDNMSRNIHDLLAPSTKDTMQFEKDFENGNDDVLSRVKRRLEEATALEYLVQQNQIREEILNESRIRHSKVDKLPPILKAVKIIQKKEKNGNKLLIKQKQIPIIPTQRKKAWEDPLQNKHPNRMRISKTVLSSNMESGRNPDL